MTLPEEQSTNLMIADPRQLILKELEVINLQVNEISMMLDQSRGEMEKLSQKTSEFAAGLQMLRNQPGRLPPNEVFSVFDKVMEEQQRLFIMRGQMERLQSELAHLEHSRDSLKRLLEVLNSEGIEKEKVRQASTANMEMLVNVQEAERQRLSRQMHDGPAQALSNFILQTEIALKLFEVDPIKAKEELGELKFSAMKTFQKIRNFIFELRPMMLDDLGLAPTIRRYIEMFKGQSGVEMNVVVTGTERRIEPYIETMIFRSMQELISFAVDQNQASQVKAQLDMEDRQVRLTMDDNGKGFDTDALGKEPNLGLKLIRERAESLGGSLELISSPGKGARLTLTVPMELQTNIRK